ncbi:MAG: PAS-domain containing protein [Alphaproteobacteria bacterium]|nr:PAS-domain containing protein [Alphaproteobacteria bacterium]
MPQAYLAAILASIDEGMAAYDGNRRLVGWNRQFRVLLDLPPGLLRRGRRFDAVARFMAIRGDYGPDPEGAAAHRIAEAFCGNPSQDLARRVGQRRLEIARRPLPDGGLVVVVRDVTALKNAEQRLQDAIDAMSSGIGFSLFDADDRLVMSNHGRWTHTLEPEIMAKGRTFAEIVAARAAIGMYKVPADQTIQQFLDERIARHQDPSDEPQEIELADGRIIHMRERRTAEGGWVALGTDVTDLKRAARAREQAEQRLRDAIGALSDRLYLWDPADRLMLTNAPPEDWQTSPVEDAPTFEAWLRARVARGRFRLPDGVTDEQFIAQRLARHRDPPLDGFELDFADGRTFLVHERRTAEGGIVLLATDVSALKATIRERVRAEQRLRDAIDALSDQFVLYDGDDKLVISNMARSPREADRFALDRPGITFADAFRQRVAAGLFKLPPGMTEEQYIQERMSRHRSSDGAEFLIEEPDGRVLLTRERKTAEGGRVVVRTDITALKAAEREALRARDAAESASRAKSDFLSRMSHELRTPMNAILGFTQLLQLKSKGSLTPTQSDYVHHVFQAGTHLLRLIDDVLDITRIEGGRITIDRRSVSVASLLAEVEGTMSPIAAKAGVAMTVTSASGAGAHILADRTRAAQVLLNLCSNAIKYNRPGGKVEIATAPEGSDAVTIAVADTGVGIPPDRRDELFKPFNRIGRERTGIEGTGLGLALCKQLATLMGATIDFSSEPGVGSRFWVTFPRASTGSDVREDAPAAAIEIPGQRALRILYVDDDSASRDLMGQILSTVPGAIMAAAPDARLALDIARSSPPNVILLSVDLPGIAPAAVLESLRSAPETSTVPVIAVSAATEVSDASRHRSAGFAQALSKPLAVDAVLGAIAACVAASAPD